MNSVGGDNSGYSFSGDQRYLQSDNELSKPSPGSSLPDQNDSGSYRNFKITLQPMNGEQDSSGQSGFDNNAQTCFRSLHTISDVTEISSPNILEIGQYSPGNPFYPRD